MFQIQPKNKPNSTSSLHQNLVVQPKLKIGQPGDRYEQEADAVANQVMSAQESESVNMQPMEEEEESLQMQPIEEEEELIQPKPESNTDNMVAEPQLESQLSHSKGSGSQMDTHTMSTMQDNFGVDFSGVRIHNDNKAISMNQQLNAQAFTVGNNIYFNTGMYTPKSRSGQHLLAHELTHVVQQGGGIHPMIQKNGDGSEQDASSGSSTPLADLLSGLVRDQLSNSSMRGHLSSLGTALQGLAVESTTEGGDQPSASAERLSALGISRAFEITSGAILQDPAFARLRQRIIEIIGSSDEVALIAALAGGLAAVLADVSLSGSPSQDLGAGFSVGGSFDFGSIQSLQFNNLQLYAQYASEQFRTRLTGTVSRDAETEEFSGTGSGEVRVGTDVSHLLGRVTINSDGEVVLFGRLSSGQQFGGSDRLVFTTDLTHSFATGETIVSPGLSGRFSFGSDQSLRIGSSLAVSSESGVTGLTGFVEYRQQFLQLRIEGSMTGLGEETGIAPGGDMRVQGTVTIPLW